MSPKRNFLHKLGDAANGAISAFRTGAQRNLGGWGGGIWTGGGYDEAAYLASYYETRTIPRTDTGLAAAFAISVWAYRATSVRASMAGSIPWHIRNVETGEIVDKSDNVTHVHPLAKAIKGVKRRQDFGLFELWEYSLCIWGESYFEKLRTPLDFYPPRYPAGFFWLNPIDVTPFAPFGEIESITYIGTNADGRVVELKRDDFILSRYFNPLDITAGISPLEVALTDINVEANAKAFAKNFFRNNAKPSLVFSPKEEGVFTTEIITQLRRLINEQWSGVQNAGRAQILNSPVDVTTLDSQALDDQSDSTERLSRDILAAFGVPRSLAGDTDSAQYKANDDVMQWFIQTTIQPECQRIADTVNTHMLPFFDDTGAFVFEFDFSKYDVVTEADKAKQDLNEQRFSTTAMSLYEYQKQSGIDNPPETFKDLWKVEGYSGFVPTSELSSLWKYGILGGVGTVFGSQVAAAGIGLDVPDSALSPDQLAAKQQAEAQALASVTDPALTQAPTTITEPARGGRELCVALDLANHPDLIGLQQNVRRLLGDAPATYNDPDTFHVTLALAPSVAPELFDDALEAITAIPVPELSLGVGSLNSFDKVGEHAIHFRIRQNAALRDYQAEIYDTLRDMGIGLSAFSDPAAYKPHITMAYTPDKQRVTFHSPLSVKPAGIVVWDETEMPVYRTIDAQAEADNQRAAQRCLGEFEAYATFVRNGKHTRRAFTWSHVDEDTAYLLTEDLAKAPDATTRGANIIHWRAVMSARAGIAPGVLTDDVLPEATRLYRDHLLDLANTYESLRGYITDAVRGHYLNVMSRRAVSREQARFEQAAFILFQRAVKDRTPQTTFEENLYSLIAEYCERLLIAGYADGGVQDHELTQRDKEWLSGHLLETRGRIKEVADKIYVDGAVTEDETRGKPRMWWNLSVNPSYNEGLARASKNALGRFERGNTLESCRDCRQYDGLVYPFSVWFNLFGRQLPPCTSTECGGFNCRCSIKPYVGKKSQGTPPRLFGQRRSVLEFENMEALTS